MYKSILVALDGSPWAETIIPFVEQIAGPLDLEIILFHVVSPLPSTALTGLGRSVADDLRIRMGEAREYLAPLAAELRAKGIRVRTEVRSGDACAEIIAGAHEPGVDLVGMTTHGRGGLGRLLIGSVADAVQSQAEVPVFLMRATEREIAQRRQSTAR
jgi:nucleotide-binding universal stress UspA family protein